MAFNVVCRNACNLVLQWSFRLVVVLWGIAALAAQAYAQPYDPAPSELHVMTWNVEWMFDDELGDNKSDLSREQSAPSETTGKPNAMEWQGYWLNPTPT